MSATRTAVLKLYKTLLRESQQFPSYNYRAYALRRVRDAFRENKCLTNTTEIENAMNYATEQLSIIRRQVVVGKMYHTDRLVIEEYPDNK